MAREERAADERAVTPELPQVKNGKTQRTENRSVSSRLRSTLQSLQLDSGSGDVLQQNKEIEQIKLASPLQEPPFSFIYVFIIFEENPFDSFQTVDGPSNVAS